MKVSFLLMAVGAGLISASAAWAGPRVSVLRFDQEAQHIYEYCHGWVFDGQHQLQTEMERELVQNGLQVLERRDIRKVYSDEFEMPNLDGKSKPTKGKFLSAQYTITGAITDIGVCENNSENQVQLGGVVSLLGGPSADLSADLKKSVSKVRLVAQLISVETGEIVRSFTASAEKQDSGFGISAGALGIGGSHRQSARPPIERASNEAIADLARQVADYLKGRE